VPDRFVWMGVGAVVARFVLAPLVFAPLEQWWARLCEEKQRLLFLDVDLRWYASGMPIEPGWRDYFRAWRRRIFWRWCRQREDLKQRAPLWLEV
jgi:hypothetical protein